MEKRPRHRPHREYPGAKRIILGPEVEVCPICGQGLKSRRNWHSRKTIQTMKDLCLLRGEVRNAKIKPAGTMGNGIMPVECGYTACHRAVTDWTC